MAKDYGPHGGSSRSNDRSHDRGGNQHKKHNKIPLTLFSRKGPI